MPEEDLFNLLHVHAAFDSVSTLFRLYRMY